MRSCLPSRCVREKWKPHSASVRVNVCSTNKSSLFLWNLGCSFCCSTNTMSPVSVSGCRCIIFWSQYPRPKMHKRGTIYIPTSEVKEVTFEIHSSTFWANLSWANGSDWCPKKPGHQKIRYAGWVRRWCHTASSASPWNVIFCPCCIPFSTCTSNTFLSCTTFCPLHWGHLSFSSITSPAGSRTH